MNDLPEGYRWATEDEMDRADAIDVARTVDSQGVTYTHNESDVAVPIEKNDYIERPEHRHIEDSRGTTFGARLLTLYTYKSTLTTSLTISKSYQPEDQLIIELDRNGRDRLIAELIAANNYEDLWKANPEETAVRIQYTRHSANEYTVWQNASQRIGVVQKSGFRYLAISAKHRSLGSFASMSEAGNALAEEAGEKND